MPKTATAVYWEIASNVEGCAQAGINMAHSVFGADGKVISIWHELTCS
jgi:hypothetical protein